MSWDFGTWTVFNYLIRMLRTIYEEKLCGPHFKQFKSSVKFFLCPTQVNIFEALYQWLKGIIRKFRNIGCSVPRNDTHPIHPPLRAPRCNIIHLRWNFVELQVCSVFISLQGIGSPLCPLLFSPHYAVVGNYKWKKAFVVNIIDINREEINNLKS